MPPVTNIKPDYVARSYEALTLLHACRTCDRNNYPHMAVTLMLYRCRFSDKKFFKQLFSEFLDTGYNPLRKNLTHEEKIYISNIIARI